MNIWINLSFTPKFSIKKLESYADVEILRYETFSDNKNEWIIGLIKPA